MFFVLLLTIFGTMTISITNVHGYETFTGYVKDRSNNPISGASVMLTDSLTAILGYTSTNAYGYYSFTATLRGNSPYSLSVGKTGYEPDDKIITSGGSNDFSLYAYVYGYVEDSQDDFISGSTVRVYHNSGFLGSDTTDSNGYYYIQIDSTPTNGEITAEKRGFRDYSQSISTGGSFNFNMNALKAIIVGISDYQSISDLYYCDEDASDWYDHLYDLGYDCEVYGDGHTSNYPQYDGLATESNVRAAIQSLATSTGSGDTVCFITSGHGGTSWGKQYLVMHECNAFGGKYKENEISLNYDWSISRI